MIENTLEFQLWKARIKMLRDAGPRFPSVRQSYFEQDGVKQRYNREGQARIEDVRGDDHRPSHEHDK